MAGTTNTLNFTGGAMYGICASMARTDTELMKLQQELQQFCAKSSLNMQRISVQEGIQSAQQSYDATSKEAEGMEISGSVSAAAGAGSLGCATPLRFGAGSTSTKEELANAKTFKDNLSKNQGGNLTAGTIQQPRSPEIDAKIQKWTGNSQHGIEPDVRGFSETDDTAAIGHMTANERETVGKNLDNRIKDLDGKLYDQAVSKKSEISQAMYSLGQAAGQIAQGTTKTEQAQSEEDAAYSRVQSQTADQALSAINTTGSSGQSAANNYAQTAMQLANIQFA